MRTRPIQCLLLLVLAQASHGAHASCGSAFCAINTDWNVQGVFAAETARLNLRYEYVPQDQLRAGSDKVSPGQIPRDHDELKTTNQNLIATLDVPLSASWSVSASLPLVDRKHDHFHVADAELESWDFTKIGDMIVLGRYRFGAGDGFGLSAGLKLPTGSHDVTNSLGVPAERSLQPGTGTTDVILGAFYSGRAGASGSWFAQAAWQRALDTRDGYRPGYRTVIDAGYRCQATDRFALMLQANAVFRGRDGGIEAEPEDSGGRYVFISPGAAFAVTRDVQIYGLVQLPIHQYVNGVQLTADWAATGGVAVRF